MLGGVEPRDGTARHSLRRRVRGDELRMLLLERLQFLQQRVEGIVGDLWIVEDVVAILMVPNLVAQRGDAIGWRHG